MDNYATNGNISLSRFETPFADIAEREENPDNESLQDFYSNYKMEVDSPFLKTYEPIAAGAATTPQGEEFVDFLSEMHDPDFETIVFELAAEAETSWSDKISNELAMGANYIPFVTKQARDYFEPLAMETEAMIDRVTEHFSGNNLPDFTSAEIENYFNEITFNHGRYSPAQEQFLGSIFNKVKNVVKKGVDLAKKGIAAVGKILPINGVLGKLKGLVRPLLERVLKFAIGKLPKNLQPHAQSLAKKFLNLETAEGEAVQNMQGAEELEAVQTEFDGYVANLVFSHENVEADQLVLDYETSYEAVERANDYETGGMQLPSLTEARQNFINELKQLQPGETAAPAIERFLPVAIMALQPVIKIAISIIGRQRVIDFLAGLLAKLVDQYVPAAIVKPLASSIIDIGMSAIGFETYDQQKPDTGYEAIANTIEDTVRNMNRLNEVDLNDQETLTVHLLEAFEKAAANNFPPQYIRKDLRPTKQPGLWVSMPRNGPAPYYKKFTNVFDVTIDPQAAAKVTSFRGLPLANFLRDKLGLDPSKPIAAKAHIYEAIKGTRLNRISKYEKVPGLGNQPYGWVQLHPLTAEASSLLLKEPGLGKDSNSKNAARHRTTPGERFYYLEISGAKLRIPPVDHSKHKHATGSSPVSSRPSQSGDIQAVLNFVRSEIKLNYYFSEEDAKNVVEKLNKNDYIGVAQTVRNAAKSVFNEMLLKQVSSKVKIVHEAFPEMFLENYVVQEEFSLGDAIGAVTGKNMIQSLVEQVVAKVCDQAYQSLLSYFKARAAEFKDAQAKPQDGVTMKITWKNVQGMSTIRTIINSIKGKLSIPNFSDLKPPALSNPEFLIVADKNFD